MKVFNKKKKRLERLVGAFVSLALSDANYPIELIHDLVLIGKKEFKALRAWAKEKGIDESDFVSVKKIEIGKITLSHSSFCMEDLELKSKEIIVPINILEFPKLAIEIMTERLSFEAFIALMNTKNERLTNAKKEAYYNQWWSMSEEFDMFYRNLSEEQKNSFLKGAKGKDILNDFSPL